MIAWLCGQCGRLVRTSTRGPDGSRRHGRCTVALTAVTVAEIRPDPPATTPLTGDELDALDRLDLLRASHDENEAEADDDQDLDDDDLDDAAAGGPVLLDGPAIANAIGINPQTIRRWASTGQVTRRGEDSRGRILYDLDEVTTRAEQGPTAGLGVTFRDETDYLEHCHSTGPFEPADYGDRQ